MKIYKKNIKIILIITFICILKFTYNNFYIPHNIFFWYPFQNYKIRDYFIEGPYSCKILEIGATSNYYYGKVEAGSVSIYKSKGLSDFGSCESEYFLIEKGDFFSGVKYFKNKEKILKIIKKYKVKEPHKFFLYRIY